jgi:hypothetical protein
VTELRYAFAIVLVVGGTTPRVSAQAGAAASEALFRAGRDAMQQGDSRTACAKFRESYRLEHAPGTLLNLAVCEEALDELGNAWQHYQEVVHALPADDDRVEIARAHLQRLEPRLPRLTVHRSPGAPEDTRASIGGVELEAASFDTALPMDPGQYEVQVTAPGRLPRSFTVELREGDQSALNVEPGETAPAPVSQPASAELPSSPAMRRASPIVGDAADAPSAPRTSLRAAFAYAALGAGGASLVIAAVSGAFALDRAATVDAHCPNNRCDPRGLAAVESGKTFYVLGLTTLGVGLASAGAGLYLLLMPPKNGARQLALQPTLSPNTLGLSVHGQL